MSFEMRKRVDNGIIGAKVPLEIRDRFKLYSLHKKVYSSSLFVKLVLDFMEGMPSKTELIDMLAKEAHKEWDNLNIIKKGKVGWRTPGQIAEQFEWFIQSSKDELKKRKTRKYLIDAIISRIEQLETEGWRYDQEE